MLMCALCFAIAAAGLGIVLHVLFRSRSAALAILDHRLAAHAIATSSTTSFASKHAIALPERLTRALTRAQIEPTPRLVGFTALGFMLAFAVGLGLSGVLLALFAVAMVAIGGFMLVTARGRRRSEALVDALPLYLDGVRQLMAIGYSLPQALTRALASASEPVQSHLGPGIRRIELGAPIGESLQHLADRLAIPEVAMLSAAVRTNLRFGGSMATILSNLAQILRERLRIKRELSSATAEARVSTQMLVVFPLLLIAFLLVSNPGYRDFFFLDPRGHRLAMYAAGLQVMGMLVTSRLKRIAF